MGILWPIVCILAEARAARAPSLTGALEASSTRCFSIRIWRGQSERSYLHSSGQCKLGPAMYDGVARVMTSVPWYDSGCCACCNDRAVLLTRVALGTCAWMLSSALYPMS